jgi:hypothetical protein
MPAPSGSTAVWPGKPSLAAGAGFKKFFEDLWAQVDSLLASRTAMEAAWTSYTPTLTNVTLGTGGTLVGRYRQVGKTVDYRIEITLGTGGAITGTATIGLPVATASTGRAPLGDAYLSDASPATFQMASPVRAFSNTGLLIVTTAGALVAAAAPWTWASGDSILISGKLEAA